MSTELLELRSMKSSSGLLVSEISLLARNRRVGHKYHRLCVPNDFFWKSNVHLLPMNIEKNKADVCVQFKFHL